MKSQKTLVLAASIFAITLSAFPHHAAASSAIAPPSTSSEAIRKAGGSNLITFR
jgi:Cu/Ag efflux protein CusF